MYGDVYMSCSPYVVLLNDSEETTLRRVAQSARAPHREVLRARIVLAAAGDTPNAQIAAALGVHVDTVRKWRRRFSKDGLTGLRDRPRPGRPRRFAPATVAEVKALACELPATSDTPLAKWSCPELAREAVKRGLVVSVSASTVRRWLANDAIKPWQHRTWIFPRDPNFATKAARALDLYQRIFNGQPLRSDEYVISADEKPGMQARRRIHASVPAAPARPIRVEHEYVRCGTLAYLAAYDVHRAHVFGRCEPTTGIAPFTALVDQVMTTEPYASAHRVYWIVDNGSSHNGAAAAGRLTGAYPNATMIHLPVHASWLNQVEIYFSVIQRKLLTPDDVDDLTTLAERINAFEHRYNTAAEPFDWRFNTDDLHQLLQRLQP
jgi:transposase